MADAVRDDGDKPIQRFIFKRELAEVYLLLDHISAVVGKAIPEDKDVPDAVFDDAPDTPEKRKTSWIEQVCAIMWPPETDGQRGWGASKDDARNAAKLIRAKDVLNRKAAPASGASIAFTVLMVGEEWAKSGKDGSDDGDDEPPGATPNRYTLARMAYPVLTSRAPRYRFCKDFLLAFAVVWLVLTCFVSWDVATGSALLNRVTRTQTQLATLSQATRQPANQQTEQDQTTNQAAPPASPGAGTEKQTNPPAPPPKSKPPQTPTPTGAAATAAAPLACQAIPNRSEGTVARDLEHACQMASINLQRWLEESWGLRGFLAFVMGGESQDATSPERVIATGPGDTNTAVGNATVPRMSARKRT